MSTAGGGGGSIQKERSIGASDTASVTETSLTSAYASRTSHQHVPTKSCARYSMSCDNSASSTAGATGLGCGARKDTITVEGRVQIKSHRRHLSPLMHKVSPCQRRHNITRDQVSMTACGSGSAPGCRLGASSALATIRHALSGCHHRDGLRVQPGATLHVYNHGQGQLRASDAGP